MEKYYKWIIGALCALVLIILGGIVLVACGKTSDNGAKPDTTSASPKPSASATIDAKADTTAVSPKASASAGTNTTTDFGPVTTKGEDTSIALDPAKIYADFCGNDRAKTLQRGQSRLFFAFKKDGSTVVVDACGPKNDGVPRITNPEFVSNGNYKDAYVRSSTCRDSTSSTCWYRVPDTARSDNEYMKFVTFSSFMKGPPSYVDGDTWKKADDNAWLVVGQLVDGLPTNPVVVVNPTTPRHHRRTALVTPTPASPAIDMNKYVTKVEYNADKAKQASVDKDQDEALQENFGKLVDLQAKFDEWNLHERMAARK